MASNIFLIGPMGAGKSTIGKYLAGSLQLTFHDTDREIEARAGAPVSWIFDIEGEEGFQIREEKVLDELSSEEGIVLATGGNIVLSKKNRNLLSSRGKVIYLKLNISTQFERTKQDSRRPQLGEKNNLIVTLEKLQEELNPLYSEIADYVFETNNFSAKSVAKNIVETLG
jgi:shikimate kinase